MKTPSIRGCTSLAILFPKSSFAGYKKYFDEQCKQDFHSTDTSRRPLPIYRAPVGLWGRVKVALSGATARRERACARLNTFVSSCENEVETVFHNVAMNKFVQVYNKSNLEQQHAMLSDLNTKAWNALPLALLQPEQNHTIKAMGTLQTADMPPSVL